VAGRWQGPATGPRATGIGHASKSAAPMISSSLAVEESPMRESRTGEKKANILSSSSCPPGTCTVSFTDHEGLRHSVNVHAETLYEAAVLAARVPGA
jgi:hypothetical protein